jgi:hypothetical protein
MLFKCHSILLKLAFPLHGFETELFLLIILCFLMKLLAHKDTKNSSLTHLKKLDDVELTNSYFQQDSATTHATSRRVFPRSPDQRRIVAKPIT